MFEATMRELAEQGVTETPEVVLAAAGYWHTAQMQTITDRGIEVLVPPDGNMREAATGPPASPERPPATLGGHVFSPSAATVPPTDGQLFSPFRILRRPLDKAGALDPAQRRDATCLRRERSRCMP
jgi:hypothetical protein